MKTIQIHPLSLLAGAALFGLGMTLLSAQQAQVATVAPTADRQSTVHPLTISGPVQIHGIPAPDQMVWVVEGDQLIVPAGKRLVITGLGASDGNIPNVQLRFDGAQVLECDPTTSDSNSATSIKAVPQGMTAPSGTVVDAIGGNPGNDAVVLGYLADA